MLAQPGNSNQPNGKHGEDNSHHNIPRASLSAPPPVIQIGIMPMRHTQIKGQARLSE